MDTRTFILALAASSSVACSSVNMKSVDEATRGMHPDYKESFTLACRSIDHPEVKGLLSQEKMESSLIYRTGWDEGLEICSKDRNAGVRKEPAETDDSWMIWSIAIPNATRK